MIPPTGEIGLNPLLDPTFSVTFELGTMDFDTSMVTFPGFTPALVFSDSVLAEFFLSTFLDSFVTPMYATTLSGFQFFTENSASAIIYAGDIAFGDPILTIPEPATMLLLGSGLVGLAGFRKRSKRS